MEQRKQALIMADYEMAQFYQAELNRIRSERVDNINMTIAGYYDKKLLKQLTPRPGNVITWTRFDESVPEQVGQGVQFIKPNQFHDERDVVKTPEPTYNVQIADGKWLSIKHHLFHKLKFGVMNMVYVEGTEITDVYRHG